MSVDDRVVVAEARRRSEDVYMTLLLAADGGASARAYMPGTLDHDTATGTWTVRGGRITISLGMNGEEPTPSSGPVQDDGSFILKLNDDQSAMLLRFARAD